MFHRNDLEAFEPRCRLKRHLTKFQHNIHFHPFSWVCFLGVSIFSYVFPLIIKHHSSGWSAYLFQMSDIYKQIQVNLSSSYFVNNIQISYITSIFVSNTICVKTSIFRKPKGVGFAQVDDVALMPVVDAAPAVDTIGMSIARGPGQPWYHGEMFFGAEPDWRNWLLQILSADSWTMMYNNLIGIIRRFFSRFCTIHDPMVESNSLLASPLFLAPWIPPGQQNEVAKWAYNTADKRILTNPTIEAHGCFSSEALKCSQLCSLQHPQSIASSSSL